MNESVQIRKLRELDAKAARIRGRNGISKAGEILFQASKDKCSDNDIIVEADGAGGAILLEVEGNYPIDYLIHNE